MKKKNKKNYLPVSFTADFNPTHYFWLFKIELNS